MAENHAHGLVVIMARSKLDYATEVSLLEAHVILNAGLPEELLIYYNASDCSDCCLGQVVSHW